MSREPSAKRQRMNGGISTARSATAPPALTPERVAKVQAMILSMKPDTIQTRAAQFVALDASGQFARWIEQLHAQDQARESLETTNFAKHARTAAYLLNEKYAHLSISKQFEAFRDAQTEVDAMLDNIVARTKKHSNYATKESAVETMRRIFEITLDGVSVVANEVRNECYDWDAMFLQVMGTFSEQELEQLATEDDGAWVDKFRETVDKANDHDLMGRLQESLDDLESYQAGEEGE